MKLYAAAILSVASSVAGIQLHAGDQTPLPAFHIQYVSVATDVKLEVVDWGGVGPPLVFLAALGADAHEFDTFAPKFASTHHVYGLTRRGFGGSSKPDAGYSNERLGKDVIAILNALKIDRAVFIGHSIAGMELSWLGTHEPNRVLGLVYLEAAYGYAFYDETSSDPTNLFIDALELKQKLSQLPPGGGRPDQQRLTAELLHDVARFQRELVDHAEMVKKYPDPPIDPAKPPHPPHWLTDMYQGLEKYTKIGVPVLAIFSVPHALEDLGDPAVLSKDSAAAAKVEGEDIRRVGSQASAFQRGVPTAIVVQIPHGSHFVFQSHESQVLREVNAFLGSLANHPSKQ